MSLIKSAIASDSGVAPAVKYLIDVVAPFFEMPLTGDTDHVQDFQLNRRIGELEALVYRLPPSPSNTHRMRFLAEQLLDFAMESGVPLGSDDAFVRWVTQHGTLEDRVMETTFEIDEQLESSYSMVGQEMLELESIRKNLLLNNTIFQDLQEVMISGGPGSEEELQAFETAVLTNLKKARTILDNFQGY